VKIEQFFYRKDGKELRKDRQGFDVGFPFVP
jgi:hypothetical protein